MQYEKSKLFLVGQKLLIITFVLLGIGPLFFR